MIHGRFVDEQGQPIAGAAVEVMPVSMHYMEGENSSFAFSINFDEIWNCTDADGRFQFDPLGWEMVNSLPEPSQWWWIIAAASPEQPLLGYRFEPMPSLLKNELVLVVLPLTTIRGRVVDESDRPLSDATVAVLDYGMTLPAPGDRRFGISFGCRQRTSGPVDRWFDWRIRSADDGSFAISAVPCLPTARMRATGADFVPTEKRIHRMDEPVVVTLKRGAMVRIHALMPDGIHPAVGCRFHVRDWRFQAITDNEGRCRIGPVPLGEQWLRFHGFEDPRCRLVAFPPRRLTLTAEVNEVDVVVEGRQGGRIQGMVLGSDNEPHPGLVLDFESSMYPHSDDTFPQKTGTDDKGDFSFDTAVVPGEFTLRLLAGYGDWTADEFTESVIIRAGENEPLVIRLPIRNADRRPADH